MATSEQRDVKASASRKRTLTRSAYVAKIGCSSSATKRRLSSRLSDSHSLVEVIKTRITYLINPAFPAIPQGAALRARLQIPLAQNIQVVQFVPRDDVREGAHADFSVAGHAPPQPGGLRQVAQQGEGGAPHRPEIAREVLQGQAAEVGAGDVIVLLEAFDRGAVVAPEAQGAVGEDALGVADVTDDLLDAPFAGRVAVAALLF